MVGYEREELVAGRKTFMELTPPEWESRSLQTVAKLQRGGTVQPYEKEYFRKDGSRVPVIVVGRQSTQGRHSHRRNDSPLSTRQRTFRERVTWSP